MVVGVIREALIKQSFFSVTTGSPMPHLGMHVYLTNGRKYCHESLRIYQVFYRKTPSTFLELPQQSVNSGT